MSGDQEQEYFSDGITEDIITDLSKVSALAVVSRNSAFVYKGKHVDVPKVARELKVGHVLEGSVRKAGGRVRITAQLVDGSSNDHVWAERYDRDLNDIFALQAEISEAIVKALKLKLLPEEKKAIEQRGTDNVEAYNLYLMARQSYVTGHEADARRTEAIIRLCSRAIEIDPNYSRAWALMAIGQMNLRFVHGRKVDDGLASAERALALDANLAEAHAVKARILAQHGRHDEAAAEIEVALRLDPGVLRGQQGGRVFAFPPAAPGRGYSLLRKGDEPHGDGSEFRCHAGHLLHRRRRFAGGSAGRADHALPNRKDSGAGSEQRSGHGLRRQCSCGSGGGRTRQGLDQPCPAD